MPESDRTRPDERQPDESQPDESHVATLGGGCFWCIEAVYREVPGVLDVMPGMAGREPAEVVRITYDPAAVDFRSLLEVFFRVHDLTTPDRQGNDVGREYRSVIFYHDDDQRAAAEAVKADLEAAGAYPAPIVTEIAACEDFQLAGEKHRNYYARNPDEQYCRLVIQPKLEKYRNMRG